VPLPPHLRIVRDPDAAMEFCNQGRAEDEVAPVPACSDGDTVYLTDMAGRFDRWHETGHVFDDEVLTDEDRVLFTRLLGFKPGSWLRGYEELSGAPLTFMAGVRSPSEHFADAYAACALGLDPDTNWVDGYGYHPSARQHRRVCRAMWAASRARDDTGLREVRAARVVLRVLDLQHDEIDARVGGVRRRDRLVDDRGVREARSRGPGR
jgi:hypothetical protein